MSNEQLPLTESTFFILLSLADEQKHGYSIMKDVSELSDGRIELGTGTLYGALKRMLEQDWIARVEMDKPQSGRPKKEYQLTPKGRSILQAEVRRVQSLAQVANLRLGKANS